MTKAEVMEENLGQSVVMPADVSLSFIQWWKTVDPSQDITVRYPHGHHGLAGRKSNNAKSLAREQFLSFVDSNSQPNGRSADSTSASHYFLPKFRTLQTPKKGVCNYEQRYSQSVVGEFNRVQADNHQPTISNYSASTWMKHDRPKLTICPHKLDYCDLCTKLKEEIRAKQTTLNRIRQSGSATEEEQAKLLEEIAQLNKNLDAHKEHAQKSHTYYHEVVQRSFKEMENIQQQTTDLETVKHNFTLVLSADYQMQKLVPYWGFSPQPGSTYYLQKLSHDILGIVNHSTGKTQLYIFNETVGPKNTDHTVSYLQHYICQSGKVPSWVRRVHLYLDNTGSTNKNAYFMV